VNRSEGPSGADSAGGVGTACEKVNSGGDGVPGWACGDEVLGGCEGDLRCRS
jgi:hypothetical protein